LQHDQAQKTEVQRQLAAHIPHILSYLRIPECKNAPMVNRYWNLGAYGYRDYIDLRDCVPCFVYRPHNSIVENVLIYENLAFSAGDRRIHASDFRNGKTLATVARTAGEIPSLVQFHDEMYYADVNGAIKSSMISHDPKNMLPGKTLWDHTRSVTKIMWNLPTIGMCSMHGIIDHVCTMFTCSEDRSIRVWNTTTYECLKVLDSKTLRSSSFLSMTQSGRHLFIGTTNARIAVFSKHNCCDRDDIHACSTPGTDKSYCLQITLKLPESKLASGNQPGVTHIMCAGPNYEFSTLWAGDTIGNLTLWSLPATGLEITPLRTWKAHDGAVRGLTNTWRHGISIGDDGMMMIYELASLELMRKIDVMAWCVQRNIIDRPDVPRKLKSLALQEDFQKGGTILIGTSYGDVIVSNIGTQL
jgi:WD40 repeat protein